MKPLPPRTRPATLADLGPPPPAYQRLQDQLRPTSWICQGSVVSRPLLRRQGGRWVPKGPYYLWTCKVKGRTVCVSLSKPQYQLLAQAIKNNRRLQRTIEQMQAWTRQYVLTKVPGVKKRK